MFTRTAEVNVKSAESAVLNELYFNPEVRIQRREVTDKPCPLSCPERLWGFVLLFCLLACFFIPTWKWLGGR